MSEELNAIFTASTHGRTDIVQAAIDSIRGGSFTHDSLKRTNETIANLISTGRAEDNATPLHIASSLGHADVIRALLSAGANLNVRASHGTLDGLRPYEACNSNVAREAYHVFLFEGIAMSDIDRIRALLDGGIPASVADSKTKDTPLHWAASFGSYAVTDLLLSRKPSVDVNACNTSGQTAFHLACKSSSKSVAALLIKNGADLNIEDEFGNLASDYVIPANFPSTEDAIDLIDLLRNPPSPQALNHSDKQLPSSDVAEKGEPIPRATAEIAKPRRQTLSVDESECSVDSDARSSRVRGLSADGEDEDMDDLYGGGDGCSHHTLSPILVLWPPPQRMSRRSFNAFVLSNDVILTLTAPSSELETVSLLIETFHSFNVQTEISSPSVGAVVKLLIDDRICPKRNSYELIIDPDQIQIFASDSIGLRYAVHAFIQLLQLHSDLTVLDSGVTVMRLPSICISDWPDIESRAILWSHRSIALHSKDSMQNIVALLSKLHLNTILLAIDPHLAGDGEELTFNHASEGGMGNSWKDSDDASESDNVDEMSESMHNLSDLCGKHQLKLVPTLALTSLRQFVLPTALRHFKGDTIVLNLDYTQAHSVEELVKRPSKSIRSDERTESEDSTPVVTKLDVENALKQRCADIISCVQKAGFSTIILVSNAWTKSIAKPQEIAFRFGLACIERPASLVFPKQLFIKPFICVKEIIHMLYTSTMRAREIGSSICVLPAFVDSDCLMPLLLIKYHCFLHAGFAWNSVAVTDMLGEPADADANVLREVAYLMIFSQQSEGSTPEVLDAILSLFTGQIFSADRPPALSLARTESNELDKHSSRLRAASINENKHMARVDRVLYTLLTTRENVSALPAITKEEAAMCVKAYRRLLLHGKWKFGQKCSSEIDEFFSMLHLLHTLAKVIFYSYGSREKTLSSLTGNASSGSGEYLTYSALLGSLSPGTNSDTANAFLEGIEHCTTLWRKRFQSIWFFQPKFYETLKSQQLSTHTRTNVQSLHADGDIGASKLAGGMRFLSGRQVRSNFYRKERQGVPVTAIFNSGILVKLPRPKVVESTLVRLFGGADE